eukprot:GAHX01002329.1.p1 GENE.GAHX01002329.1~~GAHX01002329.1.p1  ORF type:complete len:166 (-),score=26.13 GAHX01002329.1:1689-2186(-)
MPNSTLPINPIKNNLLTQAYHAEFLAEGTQLTIDNTKIHSFSLYNTELSLQECSSVSCLKSVIECRNEKTQTQNNYSELSGVVTDPHPTRALTQVKNIHSDATLAVCKESPDNIWVSLNHIHGNRALEDHITSTQSANIIGGVIIKGQKNLNTEQTHGNNKEKPP